MKKIALKYIWVCALTFALFPLNSCTNLNDEPYSIAVSSNALKDASSYTAFLGKLYAGLAQPGQVGGGGDGDVIGFDENASCFFRALWCVQELPTDEAILRWGDQTVRDLHRHAWTPSEIFITSMYARIQYSIALCNEFLYEANKAFPESLSNEKASYIAEARFIRALSYYYLLDLFRKGPIVTEPISVNDFPKENSTQEIYTFVEKELNELAPDLKNPGTQVYGRVDKCAAWMLLAKLYLNSEVYIGSKKYTECISNCNKIISAGVYSLESNYRYVFAADNTYSKEIILPLTYDGVRQRTAGGIQFISLGGMNGEWPANVELTGYSGSGWSGVTITPELADLFGPKADGKYSGTVNMSIFGVKNTYVKDDRYMFFTEQDTILKPVQVRECDTNPFSWTTREGYRSKKFLNLRKDGTSGTLTYAYPDNDFPLFRYADVLLMYAESVLRGGTGGTRETALGYMNMLRVRANANTIVDSEMTLNWMLDERSRELWWEAQRRTDLVRFGKFTSGKWTWKMGVKEGAASPSHFNVFPIPSQHLNSNPNLTQNQGY